MVSAENCHNQIPDKYKTNRNLGNENRMNRYVMLLNI